MSEWVSVSVRLGVCGCVDVSVKRRGISSDECGPERVCVRVSVSVRLGV